MILFRMFSYKKSVFFACRLPGIIHWEMGCLFTKSIPAILATHSGGANVKATLVSFLTTALVKFSRAAGLTECTLFETENERQKTKPVPIPLPRASRNFPHVKTRNIFFFYNWTS